MSVVIDRENEKRVHSRFSEVALSPKALDFFRKKTELAPQKTAKPAGVDRQK